jgi:hypothetical protein
VQDLLFQAGFSDQADMPLGQVSKAAVQEATRFVAGARGEIVLVDQADSQSSHGGVASDARSDNAAADYQKIQRLFRHAINAGGHVILDFAHSEIPLEEW